jgi:xyloglucan:xyloglucosyl transferase
MQFFFFLFVVLEWFSSFFDEPCLIMMWTTYRFLVDDVPIRRYPRKSDATFPLRPLWVYGSIWDASSWATEDGKYKADYNYQPFIGRYKNFKIGGCTADAPAACSPPSASPSGSGGLSQQQSSVMEWVQRNYLVYDYCRDGKRDHTQTPEC